MANKIITHEEKIFSLDGFWDKEVCDTIIAQTIETNFFPSTEMLATQETLDQNLDSRNNFVVFLDSQELADLIYHQLKPVLDLTNDESYAHKGIHNNLRVYKYLPGQEFKRHRDGATIISDTEKSIYSLLIYLNDDFLGGKTTFDNCEIKPVQGRVTFFPHSLLHSGEMVTQGTKFILLGNIVFSQRF